MGTSRRVVEVLDVVLGIQDDGNDLVPSEPEEHMKMVAVA